MTSLEEQIQQANQWPVEHKLKMLAAVQRQEWLARARPEQIPPEGDWRIWYLMGGRGCIAAGTLIYDPIRDQEIPVEERVFPGWVQTLNGPRLATESFAKGRAPLYRVETEREDAVVVTAQHRFLTPRGWVPLSRMKTGDVCASGDPSGCRGDDRRWLGRDEDSRGGCLSYSGCDDRQPLPASESARAPLPSPADAQRRNDPCGHVDGPGREPGCSRPYPTFDHHGRSDSALDVLSRQVVGFPPPPFACEVPPRESPGVQTSLVSSATRQALALVPGEPPSAEERLFASRYRHGARSPFPVADGSRSAAKLRTDPRSLAASGPRDTAEQSRLEGISWTRIIAIEPCGIGDFYDLTVPGEQHYLANGIWHHNSGKSRTGAEELAGWEAEYPGEYAIVAPTFADGRDTCVEAPESGLLAILGPRVNQGGWNRSLGEIHLRSGSKIYVDGADDGALRIQGKNLRGAWADEIGLWKMWDRAWNESLAFAVRHAPARIVATGTPKMGHGLVRQVVDDPGIPKAQMRTSDNVENLHPAAVAEFYSRYGGSRLGRQELDGEWIEALEGDLLKRSWWRYYDPQRRGETWEVFRSRLPAFQFVLVSVDTPLKDKESSDFVAIQVWGVDKANRYLLDARTERMGYDKAKRAVIEMSVWARRNWTCQHRTLIENAGFGTDLIVELKRDLGLIEKIPVGSEGSKGMRALAASGDLETGHCFLPGKMKSDLTGPDESSPAITHALVEEAALFQLDGSHGSHDDQVDAWSQVMNWLRARPGGKARGWSAFKRH